MFWRKSKRDILKSSYKEHSFLAKYSEIQGDITFVGGFHIEGMLKGNITSHDGILHVHGEVQGNIHVPHAIINGVVLGDVYVSQYLELCSQARVTGTVYYNDMEMLMGAQVNGSVRRIEEQPVQHPSVEEVVA
ncbi:MAG: polymer-forming cytoskeletal protein [Pseudomonadales bacterium]|nr:polymer-forming cytoskeletal protein [Pseudomonadales bacterium]